MDTVDGGEGSGSPTLVDASPSGPVPKRGSKASRAVKSEALQEVNKKDKPRAPRAQNIDKDWEAAEFVKDASYFAIEFGLPNEGENPFKITDVTDLQLVECSGEKTRNGYKLSSCRKIAQEDVLHLSQLVDGYERPVNGVLAHTFVKGIYVDRVLNRKVNWASYAASKLKGQLVQREREGKGRPHGPPYVRKTGRMYNPVEVLVPNDTGMPNANPSNDGLAPEDFDDLGVIQTFQESCPTKTPSRPISLVEKVDIGHAVVHPVLVQSVLPEVQGQSLLIGILEAEMVSTRALASVTRLDASKVCNTSKALKTFEGDRSATLGSLDSEIQNLEEELKKNVFEISIEESKHEELVIAVELELEGQCASDDVEGESTYLDVIQSELKKQDAKVVNLKDGCSTIEGELTGIRKLCCEKISKRL